MVLDAGTYTLDGQTFEAGVSAASVEGAAGSPASPHQVPHGPGMVPQGGVASNATMRGFDGGWAILCGTTPFMATTIGLAIDEDQTVDDETFHTAEQVSFLVVE